MKVGEGAGRFDTAIVEQEFLRLMRIACCEMCDRWYDLKQTQQMCRMVWICFTNRKAVVFNQQSGGKNFHFPTSSLPVCVANSAEFRICASDV